MQATDPSLAQPSESRTVHAAKSIPHYPRSQANHALSTQPSQSEHLNLEEGSASFFSLSSLVAVCIDFSAACRLYAASSLNEKGVKAVRCG